MVAATSARAVTRIPQKCNHRPATRLCAIHFHQRRASHYHRLMGLPAYPYHWQAERYPSRRSQILNYWARTQHRAHKHYMRWHQQQQQAPWLHGTWYQDALCVHHYEGAWNANTGNGYYGGLQMDISFQSSYGSAYVVVYGTADNWPVADQLHAAYRAWQSRGWTPWPSTAAMCGLL